MRTCSIPGLAPGSGLFPYLIRTYSPQANPTKNSATTTQPMTWSLLRRFYSSGWHVWSLLATNTWARSPSKTCTSRVSCATNSAERCPSPWATPQIHSNSLLSMAPMACVRACFSLPLREMTSHTTTSSWSKEETLPTKSGMPSVSSKDGK